MSSQKSPAHKISTVDELLNAVIKEAIDQSMSTQGSVATPDAVFITKPVSMLEFALSPAYLDLGNAPTPLYKKVKDLLALIDDPDMREVYLILGKGSGKSTICSICLLYGAYLWSCYRDPYSFFQLQHNAKVACVNVSVSRDQARDVIFEGCLAYANRAPCFKGKFNPLKESMSFTSGITLFAGHGNAAAWLGYATFVGCMDEVEYMVDSNNRSQAQLLYNALRGSLRTRFPKHYKLICISSAKERMSFLMRKAQNVLKQGELITV